MYVYSNCAKKRCQAHGPWSLNSGTFIVQLGLNKPNTQLFVANNHDSSASSVDVYAYHGGAGAPGYLYSITNGMGKTPIAVSLNPPGYPR